ncbi:MAG TPA: hypothetical protein VGK73_16240 [Polyangiaceae bacterium]
MTSLTRNDETAGASGSASGTTGNSGAGGVAGSSSGSAGLASGAGGQSAAGGSSSAGTSGASGTSSASGAAGMSGSGGGGSGGGAGTLSGGTTSGGSGGSTSGTGGGGSGGTGSSCTDDPPPNGTCEDAVAFGWCGQDWMNGACARSCSLCTGAGGSGSGGSGTSGSSGSAGKGGNANTPPPPNITNGQNAWGSRYWDCCKPACGWSANAGGTPMKSCNQQNQTLGDNDARNACESGGTAFMCWNGAPWQVGDQLSYGFAAASGPNYQCGRCFHVQFDGGTHNAGMNPGAQSLVGKHMIVQVINNGGVAQDQFDILIPGGGVGLLNACTNQWGTSDLGAQYGGFLAGCNGDRNCVQNKCDTIFADKPELAAGCDWFLGWYNAADNPTFKYERIACPAEITQRSGLSDR